jgi:signal transduction histidine kinase
MTNIEPAATNGRSAGLFLLPPWLMRLAVIAMLILAGCYTLWAFLDLPAAQDLLLGGTLNLPVVLLATFVVFATALQKQGSLRRGWLFIGTALLLRGLGSVWWTYRQLVLQIEPFTDAMALLYIFLPLVLIVGFSFLPRLPLLAGQRRRVVLDVGLLVLFGASFLWAAFFADGLAGTTGWPLILALLNPLLDVLLLAVILVFASQATGPRLSLMAALVGLLLLVVADVSFNLARFTGVYQVGAPLDALAIWPQVCLALSAYWNLENSKSDDQNKIMGNTPLLSNLENLLYPVALITFGIISVKINFAWAQATNFPLVLIGLASILVTSLLLRQRLALHDNALLAQELQHLNATLEARVQERSLLLEESRQQLIASENLAGIGRLTAGLAHEINTPLATALATVRESRQLAAEYSASIGLASVSQADHLELANELAARLADTQISLDRLGEFVRRVREQTRRVSSGIERFDPAVVVQEALYLLGHEARRYGVDVVFHAPEKEFLLYGDSMRFSQVVTNLVSNAIHACEKQPDQATNQRHGRVEVSMACVYSEMLLWVHDNGIGISSEQQQHIFKPLFSTKSQGTGLGLAIVGDIVSGHFGGSIAVESLVGEGTTFTVRFALAPQATAPA